MKHEIIHSRRDIVRRQLRVASTQYLTPRMLRIVFESDELAGFDSPSPDDHIKIFLPAREAEKPVMRDFTPRAWDTVAGTMTLEFALHDAGPAAQWARSAKAGDTLEIGGPRGSAVVPDDFDWYLLIGDASALPSIARSLQSLRPHVPALVVALVEGAEEQQTFETRAGCHMQWVHGGCNPAADAVALRQSLESLTLPQGDGYVWIAAEAGVSRELYRYITETRQHPTGWVKAAAYWTHGE